MSSVDEDTLNIRKGMGQSAVENLREWLTRRNKTRQEALAGITLFFHESDRAAVYAEKVLLEEQDPIESALQVELEKEVVSQWTKRVASWDAISQLSVSTHNEDRSWEPFWLYNEQVWIRGLLTPGQMGIISGENLGVGKTGFGVRLMAPTVKAGRHVLTNIRLLNHPDSAEGKIHDVTRLSDILRIGIELERDGVYWIAILDESNFFFSRRDATTKEVKSFEKFMRWVRKLNGSLLLITHFSDRDVPEIVKPLLTSRFEKLGKPRMRVEIRSPEFKFFRRINQVPDADAEEGWRYDTKAKAGLEVDVDIGAMQAWVNSQAPRSDREETDLMLRYLDERPPPPGEADDRGAVEDERDPVADAIEEVAANPVTFRTEKGRVNYDAIRRRFKDLELADAKVYEIGRQAKVRW